MKEEKTGMIGVEGERQDIVNSVVETVIRSTDAAYGQWLAPFRHKLLAVTLLIGIAASAVSYVSMPNLGYSYIKAGKDNTRQEIYSSVQSLFGRQ